MRYRYRNGYTVCSVPFLPVTCSAPWWRSHRARLRLRHVARAEALAGQHPQVRADARVGGGLSPVTYCTSSLSTALPTAVAATALTPPRPSRHGPHGRSCNRLPHHQVLRAREEARALPLEALQQPGPQPPGTVRFVCVSDTHSTAPRGPLPAGDCLTNPHPNPNPNPNPNPSPNPNLGPNQVQLRDAHELP